MSIRPGSRTANPRRSDPTSRWPAVVLAIILLPSIGAAQVGGFTVSPILTRGEPAPGGGRFFDCDGCEAFLYGDHVLNDNGEVVLFSFVPGGFTGLYLVSSTKRSRIVDFVHGIGDGSPVGLIGTASINNLGQVALNAGPVINNTIVDALFIYDGGQLTRAVSEGDKGPTGLTMHGCGFSGPSINDGGGIAFSTCLEDSQGNFVGNGVFTYSGGSLRKVAVQGDPSPLGGTLAMVDAVAPPVQTDRNLHVLFSAGQIDPVVGVKERFGLFLSSGDSVKKIELSEDVLPNGSSIEDFTVGLGALNNHGDVAFSASLSGTPDSGVFLNTGAQTKTIVLAGEPTPIGGAFRSLLDPANPEDFPRPALNDNGVVAIQLRLKGGSSPEAIFLASPNAILKVVGVGDRLPTGEKIREILTFSLNNLGQVAFFAYGQTGENMPLGVYLATPMSPAISSIKIKNKASGPQLIINGQGFITNDSVVQINGQPLETEYPADSREDGGTTTRLISRDPQLAQLLPVGQSVQVTVINPLTARQSEGFTLTR
jgi:hypothetical protein